MSDMWYVVCMCVVYGVCECVVCMSVCGVCLGYMSVGCMVCVLCGVYMWYVWCECM